MARRLGLLRAKQVETLEPGRHHDGGGLYLLVGKVGNARSWIFRFRKNGKLHDYGLGPTRVIGLALARERATACRLELYSDSNPIEARKQKRATRIEAESQQRTFQVVAEAYINMRDADGGWHGSKNAEQWRQSMKDHVYPARDNTFGKMPVSVIDTDAVVEMLTPLWASKTETASRVRGRIEQILDWAKVKGWRASENPARWRGHLDQVFQPRSKLRPVKPRAAMPYVDLPAFLAELRAQPGVDIRALEYAILAGGRTEDVLGAVRPEINRVEGVWTIPAARMKIKTNIDHVVPLTARQLAILDELSDLAERELIRVNDHVFPGNSRDGGLGPMALRRVMSKFGREFDVHGFRATFATWAEEQTEAAVPVIEMCLAHKTKDPYRRGVMLEKRRDLMQLWDEFCTGRQLE